MFRADASTEIGAGHVMRCIALADALRSSGSECRFICREHKGNLIDALRRRRFVVHPIPDTKSTADPSLTDFEGATKFNASQALDLLFQEVDYEACREHLLNWVPDWVVVDHYDLGLFWEQSVRLLCEKVFVIDDFPSRPHDCTLLLDQTIGREHSEYSPFVDRDARILCGSAYALLRAEFASQRYTGLRSRQFHSVQTIMVSMGGSDLSNITTQALLSLTSCRIPLSCEVTVILGPQSCHIESIRALLPDFPWKVRVLCDVGDMAKIMSCSDLAIGAAGSSAWERCCMGLPSVTIPIAPNQLEIADALDSFGATRSVVKEGLQTAEVASLINSLFVDPVQRRNMSVRAARCVDGLGAPRVAAAMEQFNG